MDVGHWLVCILASARAECDLLVGKPASARAHLAPLLDPDTPQAADVAPLLPLMAWALLDLGEYGEADEVAWQAVARAREQGRQVLLVDALRMAAMVAVRCGRWEVAEDALAEGLSLARQIGYPYGEARLLLHAGELHAQMSQLEPALDRLGAALAIFQRLGARKDVACAEQLLARVNGRTAS
jgi:tetratricopeptide (TPR) repeat protein